MIRSSYDLFWKRVDLKIKELNVDEPQLPRQRKAPKRYDDGLSTGYFRGSTKEHYKQICYEALDLIISCVEDRFDQAGYRIYKTLEMLLIKACN